MWEQGQNPALDESLRAVRSEVNESARPRAVLEQLAILADPAKATDPVDDVVEHVIGRATQGIPPIPSSIKFEAEQLVAEGGALAVVGTWVLQFCHPEPDGRAVADVVDRAFQHYAQADGGDAALLPRLAVLSAVQVAGLNPTSAEINVALAAVGDPAALSISQFRDVSYTLRATRATNQDFLALFQQLDKDGSGYLDASEFKALLQGDGEPLTDEEVSAALALVDRNGDGRIDLSEFVAMLREDATEVKRPETPPSPSVCSPSISETPSKSEVIAGQLDYARSKAAANFNQKRRDTEDRRRVAEREQTERDAADAEFRRQMEERSQKTAKAGGCCVVS